MVNGSFQQQNNLTFFDKKILKRGTSKKNKNYKKLINHTQKKRGDAEEACWAHNPEVGGSKPFPANLKHGI